MRRRAWRRRPRGRRRRAARGDRGAGAVTRQRATRGGLFGGQLPEGAPTWGPLAAGALPEERRKATVLFADLSGYTAVAERMDPEAVKSFIDRACSGLGQEVVRYGGTVDKYIGDNVMAVFGAPVAHEDDPERAVRAGLAMQGAMEEINKEIEAAAGVTFSLRVGINSGEVLAGQVGDGYTVIGDSVNVAARLQAAARPGSVTVGEMTHRLTRGHDRVRGARAAEPEGQGRARGRPGRRCRLLVSGTGTRGTRVAAPMIGREDESSLLLSLFDRVVTEERPHLVTVIGQAGVGKSRLLRDLAIQLAEREQKAAFRVGHCPAYGSGLAYWALGEIVRGQFEIVDTDDSELAWTKLLHGVESVISDEQTDESPERLAATLARPLGIEPPGQHAAIAGGPDAEDPQQMRDRLFSATRSLIEAASHRWPVVIAIEDIHWADEGMLDLIEYLARWVRGPALIACMARDELLDRRPGWGGGRRNATTMALEPLTPEETRDLVAALLPKSNGGSSNGAELVPQVAERSAGNPLFAEEMVNRIREGGSKDVQTLPETVHAVLAARLDSLSAHERRVLQHASVVGQTFWGGSLSGVEVEEGIHLESALDSLEEKDMVVSSAGSRLAGEHEYAFKHVLIRDVAYSTLPKSVRARKHAEVGAFIEDLAADRSEGVVAMVADHYRRAAALGADADVDPDELERINQKALAALEAAGDGAASLYSNQEALEPLRDGAVARARARSRRAGADRREAWRRRASARPGGPGDRGLGGVPGVPPARGGSLPGRRPAPQDRRGAVAQG